MSASTVTVTYPAQPVATARPATCAEARIDAIDGLRGVLAFTVCISHYFGEVPHGVAGLMLGWIGVKAFFVLSGFLVARIILENFEAPNFFKVFFIRRLSRTLPAYLALLAVVFACVAALRNHPWVEAERFMPLWSYVTFTHPLIMIARDDYGSDWLIPTWTLTVEEQFYLMAPLICLFVPRRFWLRALLVGLTFSVGFRVFVFASGLPPKVAFVTLPSVCHSMFLGMIAALVLRSPRIDWSRWDLALRTAPLVLLALVFATKLASGGLGGLFDTLGVPLTSLAAACYIAAIVRGAPEAVTLRAPPLRWLGGISYSLYLMHMPVLGLMHGLILGTKPDIATPAQLAVTALCVPLALAIAWASARWIEAPMIAYGRSWKWSKA